VVFRDEEKVQMAESNGLIYCLLDITHHRLKEEGIAWLVQACSTRAAEYKVAEAETARGRVTQA
jgi:hypothetical protein